jgi:2-dehydro-3-deoxyphosphooctonate aldolase (KDO 8-P synthase)
MAGPCAVESELMCLQIAEHALKVCERLQIPYIFKGSYRKANRSSISSFTGIGDEKALKILAKVKAEFNIPVVTDIHAANEAAMAAEYVDVLQIPAFLCRQTDILQAAAATGKWVNIKKGQFLAPTEMQYALEKAKSTGNTSIMLCERGTTFGYHNLVVDMRSLAIMRTMAPVIFDATHSVQLPGQKGGSSGGQREYVSVLARAATAVGVDGLFFETHPRPEEALSDGPNSMHLADMEALLTQLLAIDGCVKGAL